MCSPPCSPGWQSDELIWVKLSIAPQCSANKSHPLYHALWPYKNQPPATRTLNHSVSFCVLPHQPPLFLEHAVFSPTPGPLHMRLPFPRSLPPSFTQLNPFHHLYLSSLITFPEKLPWHSIPLADQLLQPSLPIIACSSFQRWVPMFAITWLKSTFPTRLYTPTLVLLITESPGLGSVPSL